MPLDSFCIAGLAAELDEALAGARIDKIHMPGRDRVLIQLRGEQGPVRLLLSAGSDARVHLTDTRPENPDAPPMLCMLLRKHLGGGRVVAVEQPGRERALCLRITAAGELGDITEKRLICEMTGRLTNLILVDAEGIIQACLKAVGHEQSPRPVLPGLRYAPPPAQEKPDLVLMDRAAIEVLCGAAAGTAEDLFAYISARAGGLSPLVLRECIHRAGGGGAALAEALAGLKDLTPRPFMLLRGEAYADIAPMEIGQYPDVQCRLWPGFSALLDDFYRQRAHSQAMKGLTSGLQKTVQTARRRLERKLGEQLQELATAQNRQALKNRADLITANLHAIRPGDAKAVVVDYFDPALPQVELDLDTRRTPQQNAQGLYKKYARLKNAEAALTAQIEKGTGELAYLDSVLYALTQVSMAKEAQDIRQELEENGYVRHREKGRQRPRPAAFAPRRYELPHGFVALCGRNNAENDRLTHREAQKHDLWLHARNIPGAHVILETGGREVPDDTLEAAAALAAQFSAGAGSGRVAVDYCLARHVKKPQGARPGMVNYFNYKTVLATVDDRGRGEG